MVVIAASQAKGLVLYGQTSRIVFFYCKDKYCSVKSNKLTFNVCQNLELQLWMVSGCLYLNLVIGFGQKLEMNFGLCPRLTNCTILDY